MQDTDWNLTAVPPPTGIASKNSAFWLLFGSPALMLMASSVRDPKAPMTERPVELPPDFGWSLQWTRSLIPLIIYWQLCRRQPLNCSVPILKPLSWFKRMCWWGPAIG
jgi:hypothetical protein